jgi:Ras-related protein Rab-8A
MGILLCYDVTDENSFNNIRNWIKNIEQHASANVNKILLGSKADLVDKKVSFIPTACWMIFVTFLCFQVISTERGKALADEYGIKFFETVRFPPYRFFLKPSTFCV